MGFIAATIIAPNVPDKLDPLKYLVSLPQSKHQERAQEQAQALAYAALRGVSSQELERIVLGNTGTRKAYIQELSHEDQEELQEKKQSLIPLQIEKSIDANAASYVDYPYLFMNSKIRPSYGFFNININGENKEERLRSSHGKVQAPIVELSLEDFNNMGVEIITKHISKFEKCGIVKFKLKIGSSLNLRLPFNPETLSFKVQTQVFLSPETEFDYRNAKRGFFRALIRFHSSYSGSLMSSDSSTDDSSYYKPRKLNRMPILERKAIDLFRMFQVVEFKGGFDEVVKRKEWAQVGRELGYSSNMLPTLSTTMRQVYQKVVQPFRNWLAVYIDIDVNRILVLDVFDTVSRSQCMEEWKKLNYGIYAKVSEKSTSFGNRTLVSINTQQTPSFTLRSYKARLEQLGNYTKSESADSLEEKFLKLPELYNMEKMSPRIYMHTYPAYIPIKLEKNPLGCDFATISLRNGATIWPSLIEDDLDELLIPKLSSGSQYSLEDWTKPSAGTYQMQILIEGADKTWYTENGGWIDQSCGEIVVVSPHCKFTNWRHGYSSSMTTHFLLPCNWMENALISDDASTMINLQKLVVDIVRNSEPITAEVKQQVLLALNHFKQQEIEFTAKLQVYMPTYTIHTRTHNSNVRKSVSCGGKKRYFSYVMVDGHPVACEEFLSEHKKPGKIQFITCYGSNPGQFFDDLIETLKNKSCNETAESDWLLSVLRILDGKRLPRSVELQRLLKLKPMEPDLLDHAAEIRLKNIIANLDHWSSQENDQINDEPLDFVIEATSGPEFDQKLLRIHNLESKTNSNLEKLANEPLDVRESLNIISDLLTAPDKIIPDSQKKTLRIAKSVLEWKLTAINMLYKSENSFTFSAVQNLLDRGKELGIVSSSPLYSRLSVIKKSHDNDVKAKNNNIMGILRSPQALEMTTALNFEKQYVQNGVDLTFLSPEYRNQVITIAMNVPLISRIGHADILRRPKRQEIMPLREIWAAQKMIEKLDMWLSLARTPNWEAIYRQLKAMASHEHPPRPLIRISQTELSNIFSNLFLLPIVPDDIAQVKLTFENTIHHLRMHSPQMLEQYGFYP